MKHACDLIFICIPFNFQLHTLHWYPRCIKSAFRATLSVVNILAVVGTNILAKIVYILLTQLSMNCSFQCRYLGSYYVSVNTERSICLSVACVAGGYLR